MAGICSITEGVRRSRFQIPVCRVGFIGGNHVPFPFHSGDVFWAEKSDSAIPLISFQDPGGAVSALQRARARNACCLQVPISGPGTLDERIVVGEAPLFSSRADGVDPVFDPDLVDVWAYSYRSVQRPLVRVREEIGEDALPPPYWRFNEQYAGQVGAGIIGDLPNDFKFQYAGVALHGRGVGQPKYAIYGSLFVILPDDDSGGGTRTFPPFQGNPGGAGVNGGPIMRLKGKDVDLFLHLTGVRPGSILEVGDRFALSGAVAPPLPARVHYTITRPDGTRVSLGGRANRVGYFYDPADDFTVTAPGVYVVDLAVTFDRQTSAGQVIGPPFPRGDVLGTVDGRFEVFVVERGSKPLGVDLPARAFLTAPAGFEVTATAPAGVGLRRSYVTTTMPGFVLQNLNDPAAGRRFAYRYDPAALSVDFPNLDTHRWGRPDAADVITVTLFANGVDSEGTTVYAARMVVLHGIELFTAMAPSRAPAAATELEQGP